MIAPHRDKTRHNRRGQILPMLAAILPVLFIVIGMVLDFGMVFVQHAALSRALDAAALEGMRNLSKGDSTATTLATNAFNLNIQSVSTFGSSSTPPLFSLAITTDSSGNRVVNATGTVYTSPFFLGFMPGFKQVSINGSAQATRAHLVMSLVLDQSYSMTKNGGSTALAPAVDDFINNFDDTQDQVADVRFGTTAAVDVAMTQPFKSQITSKVNSMTFPFAAYTYSYGGLLNGQAQITNAVIPSGQNVVKIVTFFTDGWANMIEDKLKCGSGSTLTLRNYSECDPGDVKVPGLCAASPPVFFTTAGSFSSCGASTFPSQQTGGPEAFSMTNVSNEAMYRAVQLADNMRSQGITVYSIGMGDSINQTFLQEVANDPSSPLYDPNQPVGEAIFAPTSAQLDEVFQTIASTILLRLTS